MKKRKIFFVPIEFLPKVLYKNINLRKFAAIKDKSEVKIKDGFVRRARNEAE